MKAHQILFIPGRGVGIPTIQETGWVSRAQPHRGQHKMNEMGSRAYREDMPLNNIDKPGDMNSKNPAYVLTQKEAVTLSASVRL